MQERTGAPSSRTVHEPHWPMPQPYFVPVRFSSSRSAQSSGISGSTSSVYGFPLMVSFIAKPLSLALSPGGEGKIGCCGAP